MASRGTFGFRAKQPERDDRPPNPPVGLSRRGSITSNISNTPKMPAQQSSSSFFTRSKKAKVDASSSKLPAPSSIPASRSQITANTGSAKSEPAPSLKAESNRTMGLGISSGNTTVQVNKSGKTRNVLRRKAPMSDSRSGYARTESSASSYDPPPSRLGMETRNTPEGYRGVDPFANSVLGITAPSVPSSSTAQTSAGLGPSFEFDTSSSRMARFNSRKGLSASPNLSLPPPTPNYAHDSESSARRSESPGAFSRTSTPTSMSSQSPGVSTPYKVPIRAAPPRQKSPVRATSGRSRPPVALETRRGRGLESSSQGLTAVRESGTSSSSSSTVKASGSREDSTKTPMSDRSSPRPFSPPSRTPSQRQALPSPAAFSQGQPEPSPTLEQLPAITTRLPKTSAEISTVMRRADQPVRAKAPPIRPSREGVPTLILSEEDKLNLAGGLPRPGVAPLGRSPSRASSVTGQRSRVTTPNPAVDASKARDPPALDTNISNARTTKDPSPQSVTSNKSPSRFGFLRRNKSPEKAERAVKKGPAAGTGHEGYGKHARRGRSGSFSTSASRGRSTSSTSIGRTPSSRKSSLTSQNEADMDEFYRNRLEPKKIVGGGQSVAGSAHGSDLYLNKGAQNSTDTSARDGERARSALPSNPRQYRTEVLTLEPHQAHALRHVGRIVPSWEESVQSSSRGLAQDEYSSPEDAAPTLATRRSIHRSQLFTGAEPVKIPAPIDIRAAATSPAMDSQNTYQSSVLQTDSTVPLSDDISEGHEGNWLNSRNLDKPTKSPKRWAFFHRAQASPRRQVVPITPKSDDDQSIRELRAEVAKVPEAQTIAFYELMNQSEQDDLGPSRATSRAEEYHSQYETQAAPTTAEPQSFSDAEPLKNRSMLLPSPPTLNQEFADPAVASSNDAPPPQPMSAPALPQLDTLSALPEPRKPRLQQIGRIPRVVSKRDRTHKPPPQSFSRPRPYTPRQEPPSSAPITTHPSPPFMGDRPVLEVQTERIPPNPWGGEDSAKPASAPVTSVVDSTQRSNSGNEFLSFPSRVGSSVSAATSSSGLLSFTDTTPLMAHTGTAPAEEEEWNEYNDFLDIMESPAPLSNPKANPYDKTVKRTGWAPAPLDLRKEPSSGSSGDLTTKPHGSTYPPATPPTRRLPSPPKRSKRISPPPIPEASNFRGGSHRKRESEKSYTRHKRSSSRYSTSSIESEADSLAGQENLAVAKISVPAHLRLELLTISKLLSFDRVLFSPAHAEISSNRKNRVLILDGLGINDWAFYCAQEYPHTQISNLSPIPRTVNSANYEHHHYPSLDGPFPFPQSFFTAAVMRFPAATSEEAYSNVIKEFRRVLCPGGYLEISVLDIDMVKMGQTTRRALRGLKQRKQIAEPHTSLKPLSDNIQKMLGGKAFENMKQCMLEIPVAGPPSSSRVRSFNEKMELIDEMPRDEDRTKHLPEIGRWWYSRCYEQGPRLPNIPSTSIWDDKEVLKECEAMETGFKMLLCYAQKPNKRRTLSL